MLREYVLSQWKKMEESEGQKKKMLKLDDGGISHYGQGIVLDILIFTLVV